MASGDFITRAKLNKDVGDLKDEIEFVKNLIPTDVEGGIGNMYLFSDEDSGSEEEDKITFAAEKAKEEAKVFYRDDSQIVYEYRESESGNTINTPVAKTELTNVNANISAVAATFPRFVGEGSYSKYPTYYYYYKAAVDNSSSDDKTFLTYSEASNLKISTTKYLKGTEENTDEANYYEGSNASTISDVLTDLKKEGYPPVILLLPNCFYHKNSNGEYEKIFTKAGAEYGMWDTPADETTSNEKSSIQKEVMIIADEETKIPGVNINKTINVPTEGLYNFIHLSEIDERVPFASIGIILHGRYYGTLTDKALNEFSYDIYDSESSLLNSTGGYLENNDGISSSYYYEDSGIFARSLKYDDVFPKGTALSNFAGLTSVNRQFASKHLTKDDTYGYELTTNSFHLVNKNTKKFNEFTIFDLGNKDYFSITGSASNFPVYFISGIDEDYIKDSNTGYIYWNTKLLGLYRGGEFAWVSSVDNDLTINKITYSDLIINEVLGSDSETFTCEQAGQKLPLTSAYESVSASSFLNSINNNYKILLNKSSADLFESVENADTLEDLMWLNLYTDLGTGKQSSYSLNKLTIQRRFLPAYSASSYFDTIGELFDNYSSIGEITTDTDNHGNTEQILKIDTSNYESYVLSTSLSKENYNKVVLLDFPSELVGEDSNAILVVHT